MDLRSRGSSLSSTAALSPRTSVEALLFDTIGLQPRLLPVSDILAERQAQVAQLIDRLPGYLEWVAEETTR